MMQPPRGIRNLNPGNIEDGAFARSLPGYAGSDGRFARFDSMDSGFNAMDRLLASPNYQKMGSVQGAISRWAPTNDGNNVNAYASYVAQKLGVDPNDPAVLANPEMRAKMTRAMAEYENGASAMGGGGGGQQPPMLSAMQTPVNQAFQQQQEPDTLTASFGRGLEKAGNYAMALDRPAAFGNIANMNNNETRRDLLNRDEFGLAQGSDGSMYRISKRNGTVSKVAQGNKYVDALTPGQKAVDQDFAKEYSAWKQGGFTDIEKSLQGITEARRELTSGKAISGPIMGNLPDSVTAFTNPDAIKVRDTIHETVQRNLRAVLGPQFTQQEGTALMERAFNPRLGEQENLRRLDLITNQIKSAYEQKKQAIDYFERHGTLTGFTGSMPTMSQFQNLFSSSAPDSNAATTAPTSGGYKVLNVQ